MASERRVRTPVRNPPTKRRLATTEDEPDTKKIIVGGLTDKEDNMMQGTDLDSLDRKGDESIVHLAVMGKNLHDMYSNASIEMAICRQSVEHMMKTAIASLEDGGLLTG